MNRRAFVSSLAGGLLAAPLAAEAQQTGKVPIVGVLAPQSRETSASRWEVFREGLRELGWQDGRNIRVEARFADGTFDRLRQLAQDLVNLGPSVIVASTSPGIGAAIGATKTIPIVMVDVGDPVATGFVEDLARPGGNVTGVTNMARDITRKRLQLLKEAVPRASRIAVMMNPDDPFAVVQWREVEQAAAPLNVQLQRLDVRNANELDHAFLSAVAAKADAVLRLVDPLAVIFARRTAELTVKHRLPAMLALKADVEMGGLIGYFADPLDYYRRSAAYVDRILKGARPADLPIEQPTKFKLFINVKTAKMLGLTLSPSLLARADEVIE